MTRSGPTRRSSAELAREALAKARLYRARAREEERRAAGDFGLWVRSLAKRGDAAALNLCARWDSRGGGRQTDAPLAKDDLPAGASAVDEDGEAAPRAEAEPPVRSPLPPKRPRDPAEPIRAAQSWPVQGLELVSSQVRELVLQGRRLEARRLIVKAEENTGIPLVPATHRAKWGLGTKPGEIVGPLS